MEARPHAQLDRQHPILSLGHLDTASLPFALSLCHLHASLTTLGLRRVKIVRGSWSSKVKDHCHPRLNSYFSYKNQSLEGGNCSP